MKRNHSHLQPATKEPQSAPYTGKMSRSAALAKRLSMRQFLLYGMGTIGFGVVAMLVFGISYFVYQTEAQSWADRHNEAARNAASNVESFLQVISNYMTLAARLDSAYLQNHPETVQTLLERAPELQELIRLDAEGELIASAYLDSPVISNLYTFPQSNWFQTARQGKTYLSKVQIGSTNEPYMLIAIPAPDGGVVAARLKMNVLWDVVSDIRFGETGQAYIINIEGQIIAHPDRQVVLDMISIRDQPEYHAIRLAPSYRWHGMYTNFNRTEMVGSSAAIRNTNWIIITEIPRQEAFSTTFKAFAVLNSAVLAAGIITTLLMLRLLRRAILEPVDQLRAGATRIGQGDLSYRIEDIHQNEIGQVAVAFNEMTARLADREEALERARDQALEASHFKSRLLANVGHDLRTPINAILGYAEIMGEGVYGPLTDQQQRANERVLSNARRLLNLINSLLDQAQIEAGKLVLRPAAYRPADLLLAVRETMEIPAQSRGLTLRTEADPDVPAYLFGDPQRTQQIVINLVENALKFTHRGSVTVRVYVPTPSQWAIAVIDTGSGIPREAQNYIFEPFRQVDGSPTREHKGVGLGLSIVRQLAILMGGEIQLKSEVGQGSTFTVMLPLVIATAEDAAHTDITTPMRAINFPSASTPRK